MIKLTRWLALGACAALIGVACAPGANAQPFTEKSNLTLTEPLEVGGTLLQPGAYVIKSLELKYNRHFVQVTDLTETKVFATVIAVPHPVKMGEMVPESRYTYYPAVVGQPMALRTWFAPNTESGRDIIYPTQRAIELAVAVKEPVVAIPDNTKEAELKTVPLVVVTPDRTVKPYEIQAPPPPVAVAENIPAKTLPKTASRVPLYAALGLLSLGGALSLRAFSNRLV